MEGQNIARIIWTYIPPAIIVAGTIGNVLSLMVVTSRHCTKSSYTVYLAALAIVDILYLYVTVLTEWLTKVFAVQFGSFGNLGCKLTWFLSFLTSQASSWLVAALNAERMFCMYFPHKAKAACVPRTGYIAVGTITGALLLLNAHLLYAVQESDVANNTVTLGTGCGIVVSGYESVYVNIFAWIDLWLYFLFPILVIAIANGAFVVSIFRNKTLTAALTTANSSTIKRTRHILIITFLVSFAFVCFLSPLMIFGVVMPHFHGDLALFLANDNNIDYIIWTSVYNWSYLNHAVNFYLYILSGERFRRQLKNVFSKPSAESISD